MHVLQSSGLFQWNGTYSLSQTCLNLLSLQIASFHSMLSVKWIPDMNTVFFHSTIWFIRSPSRVRKWHVWWSPYPCTFGNIISSSFLVSRLIILISVPILEHILLFIWYPLISLQYWLRNLIELCCLSRQVEHCGHGNCPAKPEEIIISSFVKKWPTKLPYHCV